MYSADAQHIKTTNDLYVEAGAGMGLYTGSTNLSISISSAGQVGIGTSAYGTDKLSVCGSIHCTAVTTSSGWCDFVFEDGYDLMPLSEVARFIKDQRHLPGIPAAKEIERDGLNIGEMETKMMQKIEELTLYILKQQEEINELKMDNQRLKSVVLSSSTDVKR